MPFALAAGAAVLTTFFAVGVLHDFGADALRHWDNVLEPPRLTLSFLAFGVVFLAWEAAARALRTALRSTLGSRTAGAALAHLVFIQLLCFLTWLVVPVLRYGEFPLQVEPVVTRGWSALVGR